MAIKFVQTGYSGSGGAGGGTYDHNLMINRGLPDQHTIESITGLRAALNRKYEKPYSGIPRTDLAFDVASLHDLDVLRNTDIADISSQMLEIALEIQEARGGLDRLKEYIDTKVSYSEWSGGSGGGGSSGGHVESQVGYPLYEEFRAGEGQILFNLPKTYRMGTRQLEVYLNGLRMVQDDDYEEIDESTVRFMFPLNEDDLVVFQVRAVVNSGLHEEYVATEGQTLFTLRSPYGVGQNIMQVYRNGVLLRIGRDYREKDNHTIEFVYPLHADDYITFHQSGATDPIAGTLMESEIGRIKINHGYTTMMLHDAIGTTQTDYKDMYIDTFITDSNIDKDNSFEYGYVDQAIEVRRITSPYDRHDDFLKGIAVNTDVDIFPDHVVLTNLPGGSEANNFGDYEEKEFSSHSIIDAVTIQNKYRVFFYFYVEDDGVERKLYAEVDGVQKQIDRTDGYFFKLSPVQDSAGNIRLVYHEQGSSSGRSKIHYVIIDSESLSLFKDVVSHTSYDAVNPDIFIDKNDDVHITFASKRVNPTYFNIDYVKIVDGVRSGFRGITSYTSFDAMNPAIVVGDDLKARIVFETFEYDLVTKNIKIIVLDEQSIVELNEYVTQATTYDNINVSATIDEYNSTKLVWRSKRLGSTYGIDYCTVSSSHIISGVQSLVSGSFNCNVPKIAIDYEGISHVVFHANLTREDHENICYVYVYPDGTSSSPEDIASEFGRQFTDPLISIYGTDIHVAFLGEGSGMLVHKTIANHTSMGRYDLVIDSLTKDSEWHTLNIQNHIPDGSSMEIVYRLSNDRVAWTSWSDFSLISLEENTGRYMQVRVTMTSENPLITPELNKIEVSYTPDYIDIQSVPKLSQKDVDSIIVISRYEGDVEFQVSRDGGRTFTDISVEQAEDMTATPQGKEVVIKARVPRGAKLDAWASLW